MDTKMQGRLLFQDIFLFHLVLILKDRTGSLFLLPMGANPSLQEQFLNGNPEKYFRQDDRPGTGLTAWLNKAD